MHQSTSHSFRLESGEQAPWQEEAYEIIRSEVKILQTVETRVGTIPVSIHFMHIVRHK